MARQQQARTIGHTGGGLFYLIGIVYAGLIILFAWQTSIFVNWLFPNDQIMMKILTVICFDGMDFLWGALDLFYRFASRTARGIVRWGWGVSFLLSLLASILYLVISSMFRFNLTLGAVWINVGYGVVITAIVFQIVMVTFFLYIEWLTRHPYQDEYLDGQVIVTEELAAPVVQLAQTTTVKKNRPRKLPPLKAGQGANTTQKV